MTQVALMINKRTGWHRICKQLREFHSKIKIRQMIKIMKITTVKSPIRRWRLMFSTRKETSRDVESKISQYSWHRVRII